MLRQQFGEQHRRGFRASEPPFSTRNRCLTAFVATRRRVRGSTQEMARLGVLSFPIDRAPLGAFFFLFLLWDLVVGVPPRQCQSKTNPGRLNYRRDP